MAHRSQTSRPAVPLLRSATFARLCGTRSPSRLRWRRPRLTPVLCRPFYHAVLVLAIALPLVRGGPVAGSGSRSTDSAAASPRYGSSTIAITPDGQTLVVVNSDSNSVTLVDTFSQSVLAELAVGLDPRGVVVSPGGHLAYVANQGSDSISVVDLDMQEARADASVGDRPVGVAVSPGGRFLAVAELGEDRIRFLDTTHLRTLSSLNVADRPHGLAFTPDGRWLVVTHLLSGDVTLVAVRPYKLYLPFAFASSEHLPSVTPTRSESCQYSSCDAGLDTGLVTISTWPKVAPAPAVAVNAAGTRAYLPQTMANGLGLNTQFDTTVFPKVSVLDLEGMVHRTSEHISLPERDQPVGLPWDVALARADAELWVVHAASNDLSVLDLSDPLRPRRAAHIPVGDNPRGVVLSPDGSKAYVSNSLAGTVSVIDAHTYTVTAAITVTDLPLPPGLLRGKRLFHSSARPDLAQARWISCNTCHIEGEHDGRTWLLQYSGEVPIGATPIITRNTTSLLGMIETYPLRWSAEWNESADSEFSIRFEQFGTGLIDGEMHPTLGTPNGGRSYDLDCLAAFVDSLALPERRHTLTPAQERGKTIFESTETECLTCHPSPLYTDLHAHDVGTASAYGEWFGPLIDTPSLRFLYDSAPYLHDGSAPTVRDVLTSANPEDRHGLTSHLTAREIAELSAFLLILPYK